MAKAAGVLGSGIVGETLANGLLKHGWTVKRGSREPKMLLLWQKKAGAQASVGTFTEAAAFGDLVVLAVKGSAAESAVKLCGAGTLAGRTVIDATNPIADGPPENGVLKFFTTYDESLMERLQKLAPDAHFVKAFSCVGNGLMVNPDFGGTKPTMFIAGDSTHAKKRVQEILAAFGWEWEDLGSATAARAIEPLCILWCIPGLLRNQWTHAFKLLKK